MHTLRLYIPTLEGYFELNLTGSPEEARKIYDFFTEKGIKAEFSPNIQKPFERNWH